MVVEVGVGVVCLRMDEVLLVRRGQPPLMDQWSIPGGRLQFGETLAACALRELQEETGIVASLGGLIDAVDGLFPAPPAPTAHHLVLVSYWAIWQSGTPLAASDARHAEFVSPADLTTRAVWAPTLAVIERGRILAKGNGGAAN